MRILREVTETRVFCNYCDKPLQLPAICHDGDTPDEVNLCATKDDSGESCATRWNAEQRPASLTGSSAKRRRQRRAAASGSDKKLRSAAAAAVSGLEKNLKAALEKYND